MYLKVKEANSFIDIKKINEPILVKSGCRDMSAVKKWNKKYLKEKLGNLNFNIESYKRIEDMEIMKTKKTDMKFNQFIDICDRSKYGPFYYLAEEDLEDIKFNIDEEVYFDIFGYIDSVFDNLESNKLFIGSNCKTGCHIHVSSDFILNQLVGNKIVYLFDYSEKYVSSRRFFSSSFNFSRENFFRMSHKGKKIYKVMLKPGDSLCIPPWWWHATIGIGFSCSITKVFKRKDTKYFYKNPYLVLMLVRQIVAIYVLEYLIWILEKILNIDINK